MDILEYQTIINKTAIYPQSCGLAYCALGLTGEAGEVAEKIKKIYRDTDYNDLTNRSPITNKEFKENLKKELGDVLWYVTAIANEVGLSLDEILESNYNKLIKRRETGTLHGSGDNREEEAKR